MTASFFQTRGIPEAVRGSLSFARPVDTIVIASDGIAYRSTSASAASYVPLSLSKHTAAVAASTAVTNTLAETVFSTGTATIAANRLYAGATVRFQAQGIATATNAADTLVVRVRLGGVAGSLLLSTPTIDVANNDIFVLNGEMTVRTAGAAGTLISAGQAGIGANIMATMFGGFLASTAVDTTASQALVVTAQWSAADPGNSCRLDQFNVYVA